MGYIHHGSEPRGAEQLSGDLPSLSDQDVHTMVLVAESYERLRTVLLALSGVSLLHNLDIAKVGELAGVIAAARTELDEARAALGTVRRSGNNRVSIEAEQLRSVLVLLDGEVCRLARDNRGDVQFGALDAARRVLATCAIPQAGMRHFSSVSCAGYTSYADSHDGHSPHHDHHDHLHGEAEHGSLHLLHTH